MEEIEEGGDPSLTSARLDAIIRGAMGERARGVEAYNNLLALTALQLAAAAALIYATWKMFPRLFWRAWLNVKGDWLVEHEDR